MRSALIGMLLVLPAAIAYSSGSTSAYASGTAGKSSAYASAAGKSSTFASGKTAPTPTPTPAPAGTVAKKINTITATISLAGVPASAFDAKTDAGKKVRLAFQKTVAKSFKLCGTSGTAQCTSSDIVIVSVTRRRAADAKVKFYVKTTKPATKADATALSNLLKSNAFTTDLKKQAKADGATALESVKKVTVVSAPVAGTTTVYEKKAAIAPASVTAGVSLASLVFAALALQ